MLPWFLYILRPKCVHCVFINSVLPSSSSEQPTAVPIACIVLRALETSLSSSLEEVVTFCVQVCYCFCDKTLTKSKLGEERVYFISLFQGQFNTEGSQGRNRSRNQTGMPLAGLLPLVRLATFLTQSRPTCIGMGLPTSNRN